MLTRSGLRASSGSTPKKEVQPSSTSTPQRGAVKRKYVKRKPLEKLNPPLEHQSPIFNIHIHVHSSNADSTSHLSQVPSVVHVHLDNYKTHSTETSATVKKRRYRKRKFSTVYDSTNDEEESEKLDLTDNESLQNATENVSPKSNSSQTKVNLKNDVNKNSEAQSSHFVNLKNIAVEDNVEVKLGSSEDKGSLRTCDIIDQVNESTKLSVSKEIKDSDSDSAVNKISVLRDSCSNAKTSPFGVKKITTGNICENLSPTKRSPLKSMSPVVVLKDIFRSKEKQRDDIFVEKKAEPSVEARTELEKNLDVNVEEKNDSPLTNERFLTSSSEERSEKKGEDEKEKFTKTSSSQCDSEPSKQMFSSTVKSNESTNFKNECRGNLSSSDLDLLNLNREKGEFYSFVYESEDNETEKYLVDKKIDLAAKTNNFSDLVNKCVIKRCNGKYVVLTSFEGTEILDKSSKKSLTKSFSENSNRSDLEIMKEESCKKNASNKIIESCDIDVPETEEEVTSQRSSIHLDHIEDIPKAKTKSDYFGDAHLAVVEDNLKNATKTKKSIQESDEEINLTSETLQRDEEDDKRSSTDKSDVCSDSSTKVTEVSSTTESSSIIDSFGSKLWKVKKRKLINLNPLDSKRKAHRSETTAEQTMSQVIKKKVKSKKKRESNSKKIGLAVSVSNQTKQFKEKKLEKKGEKKSQKSSGVDGVDESPKKVLEDPNYIPLDVSGSTKFVVANLNKVKPYEKHDAFSFKEKMLFGDRVKRFPKSSTLQVYKMKQKVANKSW